MKGGNTQGGALNPPSFARSIDSSDHPGKRKLFSSLFSYMIQGRWNNGWIFLLYPHVRQGKCVVFLRVHEREKERVEELVLQRRRVLLWLFLPRWREIERDGRSRESVCALCMGHFHGQRERVSSCRVAVPPWEVHAATLCTLHARTIVAACGGGYMAEGGWLAGIKEKEWAIKGWMGKTRQDGNEGCERKMFMTRKEFQINLIKIEKSSI